MMWSYLSLQVCLQNHIAHYYSFLSNTYPLIWNMQRDFIFNTTYCSWNIDATGPILINESSENPYNTRLPAALLWFLHIENPNSLNEKLYTLWKMDTLTQKWYVSTTKRVKVWIWKNGSADLGWINSGLFMFEALELQMLSYPNQVAIFDSWKNDEVNFWHCC